MITWFRVTYLITVYNIHPFKNDEDDEDEEEVDEGGGGAQMGGLVLLLDESRESVH
jgi:hypothetical protein